MQSESSIELPKTGTKIWFKSGENPDNLYGEDVYGAVIDEASRVKEASWHAVRSTLTATRGPIKIIGNVRGRRNWAYRLARRAEVGHKEMAYFKVTALDAVRAGVLAQEEVDDAKDLLPEDVYNELYLAVPSDDGGNPFGFGAIKACIGPISEDIPVAGGVDLAKHQDWTVFTALDEAGDLCRFDRFQLSWDSTVERLTFEVGEVLMNGGKVLVDSTGVGDPVLEQLEKRVIEAEFPVVAGDDKLLEGYYHRYVS